MTSEQEALIAKAERSLAAAKTLHAEKHPDFAISRLYYAMFYLAEALLLGDGLTFSRHSAVIAAFGKHFAKTARLPAEYHLFLREAQDMRNLGDYDTGATLTEADSAEQLRRADDFLQVAQRFLDDMSKR
ncbi:MAG: HEPN domain-containing protein [Gemmatimonas sp.]|nr:HEPN domain-containing protein [Gemmatimonas sp.]